MKKTLTTALGALVFAFGANTAQAAGKLSIYNWFEYIPQELLDKFSEQHDVEVTMDTYDSNEAMLASLKAGRIGSYDVAVPSDYMVKILIDSGLAQSYERTELKNFNNIMPQWQDVSFDANRQHSIPYQIGTTSFSVHRDDYQATADSLALVFDPPEELQGKINVLDTQGEVLALASIYLGIPQCSSDREQLKALNTLVQNAKPHWASFNSDAAKDVLAAGDVSVGMIWSGFSARARTEGANIEYVYPKEGYVVWMDNVVLLKDAPNRDNALKFMDFLLEPENAGALTNYAQYSAGVTGADKYLNESVANSPESNPPANIPSQFVEGCSEDVQKIYDKIWTDLRK